MKKNLTTHIAKREIERAQESLLTWYQRAKRDLPWRKSRDSYSIWISEVMLQQTTVAAVVPYYEKFMQRFPNVRSLAAASLEEVYEFWAGLGYYSRARNLHRAAQVLKESFPQTADELLNIPGFGPYTSRAVSSQAFNEKVGVLDGNVIRVLSRRFALDLQWWKPAARTILQNLADRLADVDNASDLNQALMELGATVCTPRQPTCLLCPWVRSCEARTENKISVLPRARPRRERELWEWRPQIITRAGRVLLIENNYAPFLKGHLLPPGEVVQLKKKPRTFAFKGCVTHFDIFVNPSTARTTAKSKKTTWVDLMDLKKHVPASLARKAIASQKTRGWPVLALLFTSIALLMSCRSSPAGHLETSAPIANTTEAAPANKAKAPFLTSVGLNSEARFSPDGTRLVFVSRERPLHNQAQIYELNLKLMKEKRITFHDGDDASPSYLPDGERFLFMTATDSRKDLNLLAPQILKKGRSAESVGLQAQASSPEERHSLHPSAELFLQNINGRSIERVSRPGFDLLDADLDHKERRLVFAQRSPAGYFNLVLMNLATTGERKVTPLTNGPFHDRSARFSPDGSQIVFSRIQKVDQQKPTASLWLADNLDGHPRFKELTPPGQGLNLFPSWNHSGDRVVFSSNRDGSNYQVYTIDPSRRCITRLTESKMDQLEPAFGPDDKLLIVTAQAEGRENLMWIEIPPTPSAANQTNCASPAAPAVEPTSGKP